MGEGVSLCWNTAHGTRGKKLNSNTLRRVGHDRSIWWCRRLLVCISRCPIENKKFQIMKRAFCSKSVSNTLGSDISCDPLNGVLPIEMWSKEALLRFSCFPFSTSRLTKVITSVFITDWDTSHSLIYLVMFSLMLCNTWKPTDPNFQWFFSWYKVFFIFFKK